MGAINMGQKVEQGRHIDMHRSLDVFRHGYMLQMCRAEECSAEEGSNLCQTNRFVVCRHLSGQRGLTGMQGGTGQATGGAGSKWHITRMMCWMGGVHGADAGGWCRASARGQGRGQGATRADQWLHVAGWCGVSRVVSSR